MLLSRATGCFDVIDSSAREIVGDVTVTGDVRLLTLLPMETRKVARDNTLILRPKLRHQTSVVPYPSDNRSKSS